MSRHRSATLTAAEAGISGHADELGVLSIFTRSNCGLGLAYCRTGGIARCASCQRTGTALRRRVANRLRVPAKRKLACPPRVAETAANQRPTTPEPLLPYMGSPLGARGSDHCLALKAGGWDRQSAPAATLHFAPAGKREHERAHLLAH
jgi:hypothetical protein